MRVCYDDLQVHDLVVVNLKDRKEWEKPYIGSVLEIMTRRSKSIGWEGQTARHGWNGTMALEKIWNHWYIPSIPIQSNVLFGFKLTRVNNFLPSIGKILSMDFPYKSGKKNHNFIKN